MDDDLRITWKETGMAHFLERNRQTMKYLRKFCYQESNWRSIKCKSEVLITTPWYSVLFPFALL
jgi:hypothetical protein